MKYSRVVTRFKEEYFHRKRNEETQIGRIFSDIFKDALGLDIMLLGSGSIRYEQLGPIVQLQDLAEIFPYKNEIERIYLTGEQLRSVLMYILRDEALDGKRSSTSSRTDSGSSIPARRRDCSMSSSTEKRSSQSSSSA